mmetsp:Transcript_30020/g.68156  ORF Transcript_30020/g.68156 Transcript_30020/m.68156 type:complete len:169 (+) Transcript_30020:86-592(+)
MARKLAVLGCLLAQLQSASAVHACDSEQGSACPAEVGASLGACLKDPSKHETKTEISDGCLAFIKINEACTAEIERSCSGMAFTDDTMVCLTQWTQAADLSPECSAALPQKAKEDDEVVDKEKEEWRRKRKAARRAATDMMDKEKEKDKPRRRRRARKSRRKQEDGDL